MGWGACNEPFFTATVILIPQNKRWSVHWVTLWCLSVERVRSLHWGLRNNLESSSFMIPTHSIFPTAPTCELVLRIPTAHGGDYEKFKEHFSWLQGKRWVWCSVGTYTSLYFTFSVIFTCDFIIGRHCSTLTTPSSPCTKFNWDHFLLAIWGIYTTGCH